MDVIADQPLCSTEKLSNIFQAFASGKLPKDDTIVKKLEEKLKNDFQADGTLFTKSNFEEFVNKAIRADVPNPQAIAFFLRTFSHVQLADEKSKSIWELLEKAASTDLWNAAIVRCAWLNGLYNMASNPHNVGKVVDWIMQEEFGFKFFSALTDESLYVSKAAIQLASVFITVDSKKMHGDSRPAEIPEARSYIVELQDRFWKLFCKDGDVGNPLHYALLQAVESALLSDPASLLNSDQKKGLIDKIHAILSPSEGNVDNAKRNIAIQILEHCGSVMTTEDIQRFEKLAICRIQSGDINTAMFLAQWLLTCHKDKVSDSKTLDNILFVVVLSAAHDGSLPEDMRKEVVKQAKSFLSLLTTQLELIRKYHNKNDVPLKRLHDLIDIFCGFGEGPLSDSLKGKEPKMKVAVLETLNHFFETRPAPRNKPVMVRMVLSCSSVLARPNPYVLIRKALEIILTSLVYMSRNFDEEKEAYVKRVKASGHRPDTFFMHDDMPHDDENPGPMVEEVVSVWSTTVVSIQRLLCDPKWEVIDSTTEFLTKILLQMKDVSLIHKAFSDSLLGDFSKSIISNMEHSESYLRASSVAYFGAMAGAPMVWANVTEVHSKDMILKKILQVAKDDDEAFPKRSAIDALSALFYLDCYESSRPKILGLMCHAMSDRDWEVKVNVLQFWEGYIDSIVNKQTLSDACAGNGSEAGSNGTNTDSLEMSDTALDKLSESGCLQCLLQGAVDCDKQVQEKACIMLQKIKSGLCEEPASKKQKPSADSVENSSSQGSDSTTEENRKISLIKKMEALDLVSLLNAAKQSTDQYELNSETLLDDILISVTSQFDNASEDIEDDNAVDCY